MPSILLCLGPCGYRTAWRMCEPSFWHKTCFVPCAERALDILWSGKYLRYAYGHKLASFDFWVSEIAKELETNCFPSTYRVLQ